MTSSTFRGRKEGLSLVLLNESFPPPHHQLYSLQFVCDILQENSPFFFFQTVAILNLVSVFFSTRINYTLFFTQQLTTVTADEVAETLNHTLV